MENDFKNPFEKMYDSFGLFAESAVKREARRIVYMSSGINWLKSNKSIIRLLQQELESSITYRNYGRSTGAKVVTDLLETIEVESFRESNGNGKGKKKPSFSITNGASEGSYFVFKYLQEKGFFNERKSTLMLGHGFPLYAKLSEKFNLNFAECLSPKTTANTLLPRIKNIESLIKELKPVLVFLVVPNNPLGEIYSIEDLKTIRTACKKAGSKILIDRVCQMPWDSKAMLTDIFMGDILEGNVYVVDSFSKSESLAGIRTGYIISDSKTRDFILEETRYRSLNPIIFSSKALVFCNLAHLFMEFDQIIIKEKYKRIFQMYADHYLSEYPSNERFSNLFDEFEVFFSEYLEDVEKQKKHIAKNHQIVQEIFDPYKLVDIKLQQGFNVAVCLDKMYANRELSDQISLAKDVGVGVLTERCFRYSENCDDHYLIRVGLSITQNDFVNGCSLIKKYFYE